MRSIIEKAKNVVVKVGSFVLTGEEGRINPGVLTPLAVSGTKTRGHVSPKGGKLMALRSLGGRKRCQV